MKVLLSILLFLTLFGAQAQFRVPSIPASSSSPTYYRHVKTVDGNEILSTTAGEDITIDKSWGSITSKPTTLSGFGITDAWFNSGNTTLGGSVSILAGGLFRDLTFGTTGSNRFEDFEVNNTGLVAFNGGNAFTAPYIATNSSGFSLGDTGGSTTPFIAVHFTDNIKFQAINSGVYRFGGNSTQAAQITLEEDTDNGSNFLTIKGDESQASDVVLTGPTASGTIATEAYAQPIDSDLTAIAGLSPSNDDILQRKAGAWTNRTMAQLATDLGSSFIGAAGNQTGLTGDKTTSGVWKFNPAAASTTGVLVGRDATSSLASETMQVRVDQNAATYIPIINNTSGTAATASLILMNSASFAGLLGMEATSASWTTSGIREQDKAVIRSNKTNGFNIGTVNATPLGLWTNNTLKFSIASGGTITASSLAGSGNRMVVANSSGDLSATLTAFTTTSDFTGTDFSSTPRVAVNESGSTYRRIEGGQLGVANFQTTGDGSADNAVFSAASLPNNSVITLDLVWNFIKSDGSDGGTVKITAAFRKDNSGTLTKIGDGTPEVIEDAAGTWALSTVVSGNFVQSRTVRSGTTSGTYNQAVYVKTKVIHSY